MAGDKQPDHLVVGHVTKAHGTKGEIFVWPLTDRIDVVFEPGRELQVEASDEPEAETFDELTIESVRPFKRGLLVKFDGLEDRNAVEGLTQRYLCIPIGRAAPLDEGEVFYHQLIGLQVVTAEGETVGPVREIYETGPTILLEVRRPAGGQVLIPYTERVVRKVDVEGGTLVIKPPPGLLEI
ncbi:MAG: ribosome maturation factor RimM [Longimicrobiales bacterium]